MGLSDRETNSVFSTLTDNSPQLNLRPTYTIRVLVACGLEYCCLLILKKKSTAVCKPCAFRETKDWSVFMQRGEQIGHSNPHFDSQMYCCWWWSVSLKSTCSVSCCQKKKPLFCFWSLDAVEPQEWSQPQGTGIASFSFPFIIISKLDRSGQLASRPWIKGHAWANCAKIWWNHVKQPCFRREHVRFASSLHLL